MKLNAHREDAFDKVAVYFATAIKIVLALLLAVTTVALAIGLVKAGLDIYRSIEKPLELKTAWNRFFGRKRNS